jgi:hypothetical protein
MVYSPFPQATVNERMDSIRESNACIVESGDWNKWDGMDNGLPCNQLTITTNTNLLPQHPSSNMQHE